MMKRLLLAMLCLALAATVASAATDITGLTLTPAGTLQLGDRVTLSPDATAATVTVYSNIANFSGYVYLSGGAANQAGNTITRLAADDITPAPGFGGLNVIQCTFSVGNVSGTVVNARARVRYYLADGAGGGPGTVVAGFSFNPIAFPVGVTLYNFNPGGGLILPLTPFWAGMTFDNNTGATGATAAALNGLGQGLFDPPVVGSSADLVFLTTAAGSHLNNNPAGNLGNLGANPVASLGWKFDIETPVPAIPSTWGRVKSLYR